MFGFTQHFNRQLTLSCLLIALSTFNYGFDNQGFATTQAMTPFTQQFGDYDPVSNTYSIPPYWLSLFNSLSYVGFAVGVLVGSAVSARFGRRWSMFSMSLYALFSATVAVTSMRKEQILAARILNYVYIGMELSVVPVFQSEIVPAPVRGLIVGTYQLSLIGGGLVINAICRGTSLIPDNRAWRIPIGLFYTVPSVVASLIWFIPESPRWLLVKGREEEALAALTKLREGTLAPAKIGLEFASLKLALQQEPEQGKFKELWHGINRKRTAIVVAVNFFQQATGQAFSSQYGAIYIKSLGTVNPFDMTLINASINFVAIALTLYFIDRIGRRVFLQAGAIIQMMALFTMAGLGTPSTITPQMKTAIVAMLSVFNVGFDIGWAPLTYVVTTEIPALRLRDASQRTASIMNVFINFLVNFSIPYLLFAPYANLGSKVGFIFGSIALCALIFTHFCVPECSGKSLEQLDRMFQDGVPIRKFASFDAGENPDGAIAENNSRERVAMLDI